MDSTPRSGHYADVNGINLYYQTHGAIAGSPLILLHGGLGAIEMFGPSLPVLSAGRQVIAVDLQGHGRTADIDRPLTIELLADDVGALIKHVGVDSADLMGYSLGGLVAVQTAIRHPAVVRKLVAVSTPFRRSAVYSARMDQHAPTDPAAAAEAMKRTPMYQLYKNIAPRPDDWPVLVAKTYDLLNREFDYAEDLSRIKAPTLIAAADADIFPPGHAAEFFSLLGGGQRDAGWDGMDRPASRLAILPGLTHYAIFNAPALLSAVIAFDEPMTADK